MNYKALTRQQANTLKAEIDNGKLQLAKAEDLVAEFRRNLQAKVKRLKAFAEVFEEIGGSECYSRS